jgi:N6-L-threonylcarbamoyladenine synthase
MLLGRKDCDFSFSGLKTAAARLAEGLAEDRAEGRAKGRGGDAERRDLAAAVQAAIADQLAERSDRAMAAFAAARGGSGLRFVVAGGVAANRAVRTRLQAVAAARGFSFTAPPLAYCTDNAAMIALAGAERLALGLADPLNAPARPRWPLDEAAAAAHPTHTPGRKGAKA